MLQSECLPKKILGENTNPWLVMLHKFFRPTLLSVHQEQARERRSGASRQSKTLLHLSQLTLYSPNSACSKTVGLHSHEIETVSRHHTAPSLASSLRTSFVALLPQSAVDSVSSTILPVNEP